MLVVVVNIGSAGSSEPSLPANAMSTTFSHEDAIILNRLVMLIVVLIIGSSGSSEPSLLANVMSTTFSREDAIIFRPPFHDTEYRKSWLV